MAKITPYHIVSVAVCSFALWTLCANGVYVLGGSPFHGVMLFALSMVASGLLVWRYCRQGGGRRWASRATLSLDAPFLTSLSLGATWLLFGAALVALLWPWGRLEYSFPVSLPVTTVLQLDEVRVRENNQWFHVSVLLSQTRTLEYEEDDPEIEIKLEFEPLDSRNVYLDNAVRDQKFFRHQLFPPDRVGEWTEPFESSHAFTFGYREDMRAIVRLVSKEPVFGRDTGPEFHIDFAELEKGTDGEYAGNLIQPSRGTVGVLIFVSFAWASMSGVLWAYRGKLRSLWIKGATWAGPVAVAALCVGYALTLNYGFLWLGGAACLLWALSAALPDLRDSFDSKEEGGLAWYEWAVVLAAVGGAVWVALYGHRPTWDDTYYYNRAAVLAAGFFDAMPHHYTLFPDTTTPFPYPTFPLIAWHDLNALIAVITGLEPLAVNGFIVAPVAAALMVLAYAAALRVVMPRHWIWGLVFLVAVMLTEGSQNPHFANQGFLRAWVGKSVLLHVLLPYLVATAFRYSRSLARIDWICLALAQVAVVGLSSTGIWMGPMVAGIALVSGAALSTARIRAIGFGVLASAYPLCVGLWGMTQAREALAYRESTTPNFELLDIGYFGSPANAALWYGIILVIPFLTTSVRVRCLGMAAAGVVWLTFANPILAGWFSEHVTSGAVYIRHKHLFLLPVLGAAAACVGFRGQWGRWLGPVVCLVLAGAYVQFVPTTYLISEKNGTTWHAPTEKVRAPALEALNEIVPQLPDGAVVIAPDTLAPYLPCYRREVYVVAPRENVILHTTLHALEAPEEYDLRRWTLHFASGFVDFDEKMLTRAFEKFGVSHVILVDNAATHLAGPYLEGLGLIRQEIGSYVYWVPPAESAVRP